MVTFYNSLISETSYYRPHKKNSLISLPCSVNQAKTTPQSWRFPRARSCCSCQAPAPPCRAQSWSRWRPSAHITWRDVNFIEGGWPSSVYHAWAPDHGIKVQALLPGRRSMGLSWEVLGV